MYFYQGPWEIVICIFVYICICLYFVGRDTEWLWGGGRESMRYLVEQAFSLSSTPHSPGTSFWQLNFIDLTDTLQYLDGYILEFEQAFSLSVWVTQSQALLNLLVQGNGRFWHIHYYITLHYIITQSQIWNMLPNILNTRERKIIYQFKYQIIIPNHEISTRYAKIII